jgi:hypothetical protein
MIHKCFSLLAVLSILLGSVSCGLEPPSTVVTTAPPGSSPTRQSEIPVSKASDVQRPPLDLAAFPPSAPFHVRFDQALDPESAQPALLPYPWVEGTLSWDEDGAGLTFAPEDGFLPGRTYRLFLNPGLRTLAEGEAWP